MYTCARTGGGVRITRHVQSSIPTVAQVPQVDSCRIERGRTYPTYPRVSTQRPPTRRRVRLTQARTRGRSRGRARLQTREIMSLDFLASSSGACTDAYVDQYVCVCVCMCYCLLVVVVVCTYNNKKVGLHLPGRLRKSKCFIARQDALH